VTSRFRLLRDTVGYSASALVAQGIGLVTGLWVARLMSPADMGIWNFVSLVLIYGAYVDFGVLSAMGRDLPFQLGQGHTAEAERLEGAARTATLAGAGLAAFALIVISPFVFVDSPATQTGLRLMALVLVLQQAYTFHRTVLRAHNKFPELSRQQALMAVITAGCALAGVAWWGVTGRMAGALAANAAIVAYALARDPWRRLPRFKRGVMWALVRVGVPITLSGFILALVTSVDRVMVKAFLGNEQLGYFGLALLLTSLVSLVPMMASQVLYPRITYHFGQSGRDIGALRPFVLTPPLALACLLPVVIGPVSIALPVIIRLLLPNYVPGIVATRVVVVGIFFYSILGLTDYFLVTIGKLRQYILLGSAALAVNIALDYAAIRMGYGIGGVAVTGTPLTYFLYSTALIGYALSHFTRRPGEWLSYFARLWSPFLYMCAVLAALELWLPRWFAGTAPAAMIAGAAVEIALYLAAMTPLVAAALRVLKVDWSWDSIARLRADR
jgi:O-antigen/teichoic acid export membrane protein